MAEALNYSDNAPGNLFAIVGFVTLVAWTVLSVDTGISRGWTFEEILFYLPRDNWGAYTTALKEVFFLFLWLCSLSIVYLVIAD